MPCGGGTAEEEVGSLGTYEDVLGIAELELADIPEPVGTIVWLQKLCCHEKYCEVALALQL